MKPALIPNDLLKVTLHAWSEGQPEPDAVLEHLPWTAGTDPSIQRFAASYDFISVQSGSKTNALLAQVVAPL